MNNNAQLPEFETERLFLRQVLLSDWESYQKNFVDYEVIQHLSHLVPWPYPENGVKEFLKTVILPRQGRDRWTWAVFLKEDQDEVIGVVDLWREGSPENRGFWLAKKHWGKGLMTEAVTPVMDYAFNSLGFERLVFANAVGNKRSRRVKEKTGARFIETRPAKFVNPKYTEHEIWELTKKEWIGSSNNWSPKFENFVGHFTKYQNQTDADKAPENSIKVIDSDIGRKVGFNRVAVHHMVLPSGCRTSSPHAESHEEEFVFVLKGHLHLWLNGCIYELKEGHAIGFPAGTGIAHTFINNTNEEVHLLVAGEKTKSENLCSFPINPEMKETCGIWWDDAPVHRLGTHNGLPGPIKNSELGIVTPDSLVYCPGVERGKAFHYPGDNETFGNGFRITDKVGLKALGIWYEYLPPGKRSAFPHAHTHEEEFVYVLKGHPTVWMNGFEKQIEEGHFAAFPSKTGIAHTIINDTDDDVIYICIGETEDFKDEKITYPLNPLRNKECERKNWFWKDAPQAEFGSHSGKSQKPFVGHLSFRLCSESNANEVFEIFKKSPSYFVKVDGCLPTEKIAKHAIVDGPKKTNEKYFKEFLIIEHEEKPIGVLDIHANHPEEGICYLELLLIEENKLGKGLGRRCYELAEDYIKRALSCKKIRLGISDENDVSGFWTKMGLEFNGKTYEWKGEEKTANVREFDKVIEGEADA